jgi:hypothetical protein
VSGLNDPHPDNSTAAPRAAKPSTRACELAQRAASLKWVVRAWYRKRASIRWLHPHFHYRPQSTTIEAVAFVAGRVIQLMTDQDAAQVISGVPYLVTEVGARAPTGLADFAGPVTLHDQRCHISGVGSATDVGVRFNEKVGTTGKDVRIWQITIHELDGRFHAHTVSHY